VFLTSFISFYVVLDGLGDFFTFLGGYFKGETTKFDYF